MSHTITEEEFQLARQIHEHGRKLLDAGRYEAAIGKLSESLSIIPEWGTAFTNRGLAYYFLGRFDEALSDLNNAIKYKPRGEKGYYNRGLVYVELGRSQLAINDFSRSINLHSNNPLALLNRGIVQLNQKRVHRGVADVVHALKLDPNLRQQIERQNYFQLIEMYQSGMLFRQLLHENKLMANTSYLHDILDELNDIDVQKDYCQRVYLCRDALRHIKRDENLKLWADLMDNKARSINKCSSCNNEMDKQEAIDTHRLSLKVLTREQYPLEWSRAMDGLGLALLEKLKNQIKNIETAIDAFRSALEIRTNETDIDGWANTMNNLAKAFSMRFKGRKAENLSQVIIIYKQILSCQKLIDTRPDFCDQIRQKKHKVNKQLNSLTEIENERRNILKLKRVDTSIQIIGFFDLLQMGSFKEWKNCSNRRRPVSSSPGITILVSHRWESLKEPDPSGIQFHGVIRFIIQACMMAMGSTPNIFNNVDASEVIVNQRLYKQLACLYREYTQQVAERSEQLAREIFQETQQLQNYLDSTIGQVNSKLVVLDLMPLTFMMRQIEIWYDYTCLPQQPRSPEEQTYFNKELESLCNYFGNFFSLIIWSSDDIKRAWCFMEAIVGWKNGLESVFCCKNSLLSSNKPSPIYQLFYRMTRLSGDIPIDYADLNDAYRKSEQEKKIMEKAILSSFNRELKPRRDLSNDLTDVLMKTFNSAINELRGLNVSQVHNYLIHNGYRCTDVVDFEIIAKAIVMGTRKDTEAEHLSNRLDVGSRPNALRQEHEQQQNLLNF